MTDEIKNEEFKKCSRCHNKKLLKFFRIRESTGVMYKTCNSCVDSRICEHGVQRRENCVDCEGSNICIHKKNKLTCRECCHEFKASRICVHEINKSYCKKCSDPKKVIIDHWMRDCRTTDKRHNRFDIANFIDRCFCKSIIEEYPNCYYCKIELQYMVLQGDLATIERLTNNAGHIKSNCVVACYSCNVRRVGQKNN